jgi:carbon-monoxide dehydrogenase medium subunit
MGFEREGRYGEKGEKMKTFDYFSPSTVEEASQLLMRYGEEAKLMAGGTDVIVGMKNEEIHPKVVIDLKRIPGLNHVTYDGKHFKIGALVTVHEIEISPLVRKELGILAEAATVLGSVQIRDKGTIGGNLCHASPSADLAPPLIALNAEVKIKGKKGERIEKLEIFFKGPGMSVLNSDEILTEIQIPTPPPNTGGVYLKFSPRKAMDLAVVGVATMITLNPSNSVCTQAKIILGAVAPTPLRARQAEKILEGKKIEKALVHEASNLAAEESKPISDIRGSGWYRKEIIKVLVERGITQALERIRI